MRGQINDPEEWACDKPAFGHTAGGRVSLRHQQAEYLPSPDGPDGERSTDSAVDAAGDTKYQAALAQMRAKQVAYLTNYPVSLLLQVDSE